MSTATMRQAEMMRQLASGGGDALDVDDLRELMQAFNDTTERLQSTHMALQREVVRLRGELEEANAQLRRSRSLAALGEMAAGIAHEIRNPLGSIQLYVQLLEEELAEAPGQAELCDKINRAVTGLDAIVRDVLLFAREMKMQPAATHANELVHQTLLACEALLATRGIDLDVEMPDDDACSLEADASLMTQAIGNVVRNAIEAMVEEESAPMRLRITGDRRRVRCPDGRQAQRIIIAVEDSGPGIPPEVVERMFNPFFTTRKTGTGLGLAIVHRIVDAHGGHINVKKAEGGGARVELCLPRRVPPHTARDEGEQSTPEIEITTNGAAAAETSARKETRP
jgi:signal transduction histidine kinase